MAALTARRRHSVSVDMLPPPPMGSESGSTGSIAAFATPSSEGGRTIAVPVGEDRATRDFDETITDIDKKLKKLKRLQAQIAVYSKEDAERARAELVAKTNAEMAALRSQIEQQAARIKQLEAQVGQPKSDTADASRKPAPRGSKRNKPVEREYTSIVSDIKDYLQEAAAPAADDTSPKSKKTAIKYAGMSRCVARSRLLLYGRLADRAFFAATRCFQRPSSASQSCSRGSALVRVALLLSPLANSHASGRSTEEQERRVRSPDGRLCAVQTAFAFERPPPSPFSHCPFFSTLLIPAETEEYRRAATDH